MKCQKHNENMTMVNDDTSIDSVNQRERKPERTEKQKKKLYINMVTRNVSQKESGLPRVRSWTISKGFAFES